MSGPVDRLKARLHRRLLSLATRTTERLSESGSVAVLEYPFTPQARWGWGQPPHPELLALLASGDDHYESVIDGVLPFMEDYRRIPQRATAGAMAWDNPYWGGLDAVMQYSSLCRRNPKRYLEVGSGYSTLFARQAIGTHALRTRITTIDPQPRVEIADISDDVHRCRLEEAPAHLFEELEAGDILLLDGSHTAFMGSDSVVAMIELMPKLASGVLVGIDDIYLPSDYHPTWVGRWYGEQYVLAGMLLGGARGWEIEFPGWYLANHSPFEAKLAPLWDVVELVAGRLATSFWMEKVERLS
jgi:hypothetical protein